jgi:dihydrofolate reductase
MRRSRSSLHKATDLAKRPGVAGDSSSGLSLREIKAVGAEVGIDPALIERAARLVPRRRTQSLFERLIGGPIKHRIEAQFSTRLTEERSTHLLSAVRAHVDEHGHGQADASGMSWHSEPARSRVGPGRCPLGHREPSALRHRQRRVTDKSRVTIHMVASLDGFIARSDGSVDWLETSDEFADGETLDPELAREFLETIDCYVMGSRTYETALGFEARGFGWVYGDKPTFVLTHRDLPKTRDSVEFHSGDPAHFVNERLRPAFRSIWFVGGGAVSGECLRLGLADEVRYSIVPVLIGEGVPFFGGLDRDVALHLVEVKAYANGMVALRHEVRR